VAAKKKAAAGTTKLEIKDLGGKEVDKQETRKVKGGVRVICYSGGSSGGVKPK
jgi:hypothetical protein